jgi:23S rRNA (uracil1939-C5)-methyltransferase
MRKRKIKQYHNLKIIDYSDEVRGIAKVDDKTIFVAGAIAFEKVNATRTKKTTNFDEAIATEILEPSPLRIESECDFFHICGGCSLQYLSQDEQINNKLEIVQNMFSRTGVEVISWQEPLKAKPWGYRRKARLGVRFVAKKGKVLVGFREKNSAFLADMDSCLVLHPLIGNNLTILAEMVEQLSIKEQVAQFEIAVSESDSVIIVRNLAEFSSKDIAILNEYANTLDVKFYTQSGGPQTIKPLNNLANLTYTHPDFNIEFNFLAEDFTQVNFDINKQMVKQAINWLDLNLDDEVLDLFCGLGNFTLPIATKVASVVGIEGDKSLVERAKENAKNNNIKNAKFYLANLFEDIGAFKWAKNKYNKALIDPARSGAKEIMSLLPKFGVERIVYVSCNPATLVRDSKILQDLGYQAQKATIMDMFSHTTHIETMVLFDKV